MPKPEYESLSNVYITHLSQNQKLFRPPWQKPDYTSNYHFPPKILFWISSIILLVLVAGGSFGIAITLGHGTTSGASEPVLQITPSQADRGALISLRGSHFSPGDVISLTRDNIIPLSDTAGKNLIQTDSRGNFSDTAWIDNNWSAGAHKIYAEDSLLHKVTYFNLYINGHGLLGRPPHLVLSASTLDFGPGDPATNSTKIIILSNSGGGSISWHAHADQPWLQFSPPGSSDASRNNPDTGLVIAANRTNLQPGDYHANLKIMSNAGQANISIKMRVVPFNPSNGAIFQVSPPVMSFTASPNGAAPATQTLQIANPGSSDLQWNLNTITDTGGSWLYTTSSSGQVTAGNNQQIQIGINPAHLPVGTYKGRINLSASGSLPVQDNSQTIFVSLTIQPTCSLHASDSSLSFNLGGKQPTTANQPLYITSSTNCASSMLWTASSSTTSGGNWLTLSSTNGMTPGTLHILVKSAGMAPGNYTGVLNLIDNNNNKLSITISLLVSSSP
ncbi:MAG TPA: hypothetical protein VFN23_01195, partial [Ktedonobacteraceae bacterium]|nr:hypothetical protein [Ktedonobacteraceae bacterium]